MEVIKISDIFCIFAPSIITYASPPTISPETDESPSGDLGRTRKRSWLLLCIQMHEICVTLCPDLSKMIEIMVECRKFGQIGIEECLAEKFPEATDFFQKRISIWGIASTVSDSEVHQLLHTLKSTFGVVTAAFSKPFCGTVTFTSNVCHLLGQRHIGPSAVAEGFVLHGYSMYLETISLICLRTFSSSTSLLRFPCQERMLIRESNSMKSSPVSSG